MRSLKKNRQSFYYALYKGQKTIYKHDENGEILYADEAKEIPIESGNKPMYSNPIKKSANFSAGKGSAHEDVFGKDIDYTRTISTADLKLPIDELSIIWVENTPQFLEDGSVDPKSADYKVTAIAKSLNNLVIAIKALPKGSA